VAEQVPPALFGTLAIFALDEKRVVDIVGSGPGEIVQFDDRDAPSDVESKRARLESAEGLQVQLQYEHKGQDRSAAGKLVSVGPEFVVLEDAASSFAVPLEGVGRMQVLELPLRVHLLEEDDPQPGEVGMGMAYLRKGITWIPDYTLQIIDEETAELTLRGTIVNQAEDLVHTDVHLVVGVPHFVHTDYMAPLAVGQVIRTIGAGMAAQAAVPQAVTTQIMNRAAIVSNTMAAPQFDRPAQVVERPVDPGAGNLEAAVGNLPPLESAASADYTVYTKEDLTLRCGEKAIITLFTKKITYSHIYRWSPPARMEHSLVLHNRTDTAWTTGPCLALSDERPLSEDLLKYTPKRGNGELPVTAAINIAHERIEREVDRELRAYSPRKDVHYDLVTLEGQLKLRNYEKKTVQIVISNSVAGKPTTADRGGVVSGDSSKLKLLERTGSVHWNVQLEPDEETTLTYQYERYVSSH
jgi:hypothetical protein